MHGCIVKETLGYCRECDDEVVITLAEIEDRFVEDFYDREDKYAEPDRRISSRTIPIRCDGE